MLRFHVMPFSYVSSSSRFSDSYWDHSNLRDRMNRKIFFFVESAMALSPVEKMKGKKSSFSFVLFM